MLRKSIKFEVVEGPTENIALDGRRIRRSTVLIRVGRVSLSRKAFILGAALVGCQILDGLLTYIGLSIMGVHMEGNTFLRQLMHAYGTAPSLFVVKSFAVVLAVILMFQAHTRRWIRPLLFIVITIYFTLAVLPWAYLISKSQTGAPQQMLAPDEQ